LEGIDRKAEGVIMTMAQGSRLPMSSVPAERWVEGRACLPVSSTFPHGEVDCKFTLSPDPSGEEPLGFQLY
jgi:hypothetical protein